MRIRQFQVQPSVPESLRPLEEIAHNMWQAWNWDAIELFVRLNPAAWEHSGQNPVAMLGSLSAEEMAAAARDETYVAAVRDVHERMRLYVSSPGWYGDAHADDRDLLVAYFCCEFGLDESLPIYSGGLGILAGDHLKSASDLGVPVIGVGLLYQQGYFRQVLTADGRQQERYPENDWYTMPVAMERGPDGKPLTVSVDLEGESVAARIWRVDVGRTVLYLLDSNLEDNSPRAREVTSALYGGDREMRVRQEILLGIGGVRALTALGLRPSVFHMNEGHSAFLVLERIRALMGEAGLSYDEAAEAAAASTVFTTHTPVPAGNEVFDPELLHRYLAPTVAEIGLGWERFLELGRAPGEAEGPFGMTPFALRTAAFANGVSRTHGTVSQRMWSGLWPGLSDDEVPIESITNGIHTRTWLSHNMQDVLVRYMGMRLTREPADHSAWERVDAIPPGELWRVHEQRRERLVFFARRRLAAQLRRHGAGPAALRATDEALDPRILTIGFARRFAAYKRADLIFRRPERLRALLTDPKRPMQLLFAGKAHPADGPGKELIRAVSQFAQDPAVRDRIVFIEDYDMNVARYLVQGVDVWLNTPRRPQEASGTSGMKAAANGALNCSVLDGWWVEGYAPERGWAIGGLDVPESDEETDESDCEALFNLLEQEIVPLFYERDRLGLPREWVARMKSSMRALGSYFNTHRMVQEYTERFYLPAHGASRTMAADAHASAKLAASWRRRVAERWPGVRLRTVDGALDDDLRVGAVVPITVLGDLAGLAPEDVAVEVRYGRLDAHGKLENGATVAARHEGREGGEERYVAQIPCSASGRMGYAARVVPRHPLQPGRHVPSLVTWE